MGDWNRPRHLVLVLAVSSKIKVMCHSCIFIVFLIQCILSHLQHNMRGGGGGGGGCMCLPSTLVNTNYHFTAVQADL